MNFIINSRPRNRLLFFFICSLYFTSCSHLALDIKALQYQPNSVESYLKYLNNKVEKKVKKNTNDPKILLEACQKLSTYGFGFLLEKANRLSNIDYIKSKELRSDAKKIFARAVNYGDQSLNLKYPNYNQWIAFNDTINITFTIDDVPALYWTAAAYGGAIKSSNASAEWLVKLPRIGLLLEKALSLDPDWQYGSIYSAMISYTMSRHDPPINKELVAKKFYDKALKASLGQDLTPYISFAENVCILQQDKNSFTNNLYKALSLDINKNPNLRLANYLNKRRAEWLLDNIDELFY